MSNLTRILPVFFAVALISMTILGCAPKLEIKPEPLLPPVVVPPVVLPPEVVRPNNSQSAVCRSCHAPNEAAGAKDFSAIYDNPKSHHPVGVQYPLTVKDNKNFKLPDGQSDEVVFFDKNANGKPDSDEIQLFGSGAAVTVECASCHREHGHSPGSEYTAHNDTYLRVTNFKSALCTTCHLQ